MSNFKFSNFEMNWANLRRRRSPNYLYKYCRLNDQSESALRQRKIWMGTPKNLNDPYDMQIDYFPVREHEVRKRHLKRISEIPLDLFYISNEDEAKNGGLLEIDSKEFTVAALGVGGMLAMLQNPEALAFPNAISGVFCASEVGLNPTMWSHYGDEGRGLMIQYRVKDVRPIDRIYRVGELDFAPVAYKKTVPRQTILDWLDDFHKANLKACLTKFKDWSYEREWRLIGNSGDQLIDNPFDVISISIGPASSFEDRIRAHSICEDLDVPFYLCAKSPFDFSYIPIGGITKSLIEYFEEVDINEFVKNKLGLRKEGLDQKVQALKLGPDGCEI